MSAVIAALSIGAVGAGVSAYGALSAKGPPKPIPLDLQAEQRKAIAGNKAVLPELQSMATGIDAFNQQRLNASLDSVLPGARANAAKSQSIIADQLAGKVGADVVDFTQNQANARGLGQGTGAFGRGGSLTSNNFVKQLGLTGIDLQQRGMTNEEQWLQVGRQNLMAPQYDFTSMFVNTMQQAQNQEKNNDNLWNSDWLGIQQDNAKWQSLGKSIGQVGGLAMAYGQANRAPSPSMNSYTTPMGRTMTPSWGGGYGGGSANLSQPFAGQSGDSYDFFWRGIGNS